MSTEVTTEVNEAVSAPLAAVAVETPAERNERNKAANAAAKAKSNAAKSAQLAALEAEITARLEAAYSASAKAPKARVAKTVPANVVPDKGPAKPTFAHVLRWRNGFDFYTVKSNGKVWGTAVTDVDGGGLVFFADSASGSGRLKANVYTRHALNFWNGWSVNTATWRKPEVAPDAAYTKSAVAPKGVKSVA